MKKVLLFVLLLSAGSLAAMEEEPVDMSSMMKKGYVELVRSAVDLDWCESPIGWMANIVKYNYQYADRVNPGLHPCYYFSLAACVGVAGVACSIGCTECPVETAAVCTCLCACCGLVARKGYLMEKYGLIPSHFKLIPSHFKED